MIRQLDRIHRRDLLLRLRDLGRRTVTTKPGPAEFSGITAIPPTSLKPPRKAPKRPPKYRRRLIWTSAVLGLLYGYDRQFNGSALFRNVRAVVVLSVVAVDYKLNFEEGKDIDALHTRVADRIFNLINTNGGLYIKLGQAIAMQSAVLPPVFQEKFAKLFDMAAQDPWAEVEKLFIRDLHMRPDDCFATIEHRAIASASIGQVHKAQLKTGEWVAVKIQHPKIKKQVDWDLGTYKKVMRFYDWYFDLPVYFMVNYTCDQLKSETDFLNEARNAENLRAVLKTEPALRDDVYIPHIYPEFTTEHILVTEWIDGTSLNDRRALEKQGYSKAHIMNTMVNLFSAQIFNWGVVHCDPHPGNQIIRMHNGRLQLVLLDHGLYIYEPPAFRQKYCELWKNMFILNDAAIREIATGWGIGTPDLFASATMLRPYSGRKPADVATPQDDFEFQSRMKDRFRKFISDTTKMPLELIFLGRNMRIVQACNQLMGSPVNRIKILAHWASRSLTTIPGLTLRQRVSAWKDHFLFSIIVGLSDIGFWFSRIKQLMRLGSGGFEDEIERQMRSVMKSKFGLEVKAGAFDG